MKAKDLFLRHASGGAIPRGISRIAKASLSHTPVLRSRMRKPGRDGVFRSCISGIMGV